jgi:hypothetical protein
MPQICDFRIFTAPAGGLTGLASLGVGLSDAYHSIPLSRKKSYKVANDTTHNKAFTIQAFTWEADTGTSVHQGALPTLIKQAMAQNPIKISSATGRVYVNISVKTEPEKHTLRSVLKNLPFGAIVSGLNMMHGLWAVAQPEPNEVYFSITAMETESTKYSFSGEKTLNDINLALFKKKAWAFADPTTRGQIEAVVGALAEGTGALEGPLSDVGELVGRLL